MTEEYFEQHVGEIITVNLKNGSSLVGKLEDFLYAKDNGYNAICIYHNEVLTEIKLSEIENI